MYRGSSAYVMHQSSLPSPDYTGDSDSESDIAQELIQKRKQLDEDVARFRALKDKEFRDFEHELKTRRRRDKVQQHFLRNSNSYYHDFTKNSPSATPPAASSSIPAGFEEKIRDPNVSHHARQSEPIRLMKSSAGSKVTTPTICLDKISIIGENVPQPHLNHLHTPPTPSGTVSQIAARASPTIHARSASTERASLRDKAPKSSENKHEDKFSDLFAPPYLPLLESRQDRLGDIEGTQTEPASPTSHSIDIQAIPVTSSSLPTESSMSNEFHVPSTKRAYTSPSTLNRKTLPPIIRNVNGRKRAAGKRKHVTFILADRAIVEPSSSYEEGPSPDVDDEDDRRGSAASDGSESLIDNTSSDLARPTIARKLTPLDPFGRRKRTIIPEDTPEAEVGMNMGDLLFGTDKDLHQSSPPIVTTTNSYNRRPSAQDGLELDTNHLADAQPDDGYFSPRHNTFSPLSPSPEKSAAFGSVDDNAYMHKQKTKLVHQRTERKNSRSPSVSPAVSRQTSFDITATHNTAQKVTQKMESPHFSPRHSPGHSPRQQPPYPRLVAEHPSFIEDDLLRGNAGGFFELDEELDSPNKSIEHFIEDDKEETEAMKGKAKKGRHTRDHPEDLQTGTSVPINIVRPGTSSVSNSWIGTFGH